MHVVPYEELVLNTGRCMAAVCDFLDLPFEDGLLKPTVMDSTYGAIRDSTRFWREFRRRRSAVTELHSGKTSSPAQSRC